MTVAPATVVTESVQAIVVVVTGDVAVVVVVVIDSVLVSEKPKLDSSAFFCCFTVNNQRSNSTMVSMYNLMLVSSFGTNRRDDITLHIQ